MTSSKKIKDTRLKVANIYSNVKTSPKVLEARFEYGMVLLGISLLDFDEKAKKGKEHVSNEKDGMSIFEKISQFSRAISPTLLPMIAALGTLNIDGD
jgi:hypothetical protein